MYSVQDTLAGGFPHSEIFGSKLVRNSPKLIAAYHVLHRLSAPRHPPNALKTLDHSHCRCPPRTFTYGTVSTLEKKTSFFEIYPIAGGLSLRVRATDPSKGLGQTFSSRCKTASSDRSRRKIFQITNASFGYRQEPTTEPNSVWWSQTGSNRRPPACKAGALPTELWPRLDAARVVNAVLISGGPG